MTDDLISKLQINNISNAPYFQTVHNIISVYKAKRQLIDGEISNTLSATVVWESAYVQTMYNEYQKILDNCLKDRDSFKHWAVRVMNSILERYGYSPISLGDYQEKIALWLNSMKYGPKDFTDNSLENFEESIAAAFADAFKEDTEKRRYFVSGMQFFNKYL